MSFPQRRESNPLNFSNLIYPVFHPIVDANGVPVYYEATLRAYGQRSPDGHSRLLAVAEEMGFIHTLDCVIAEAAVEAAVGAGVAVGVNVSAFTVQNALEEFTEIVRRARRMRCALVVELTETIQPDRVDLLDEFVDAVRRLGGRIAVDDYGTGHFEEGDIGRIEPDYVKLALPRVQAAVADHVARSWLLGSLALVQKVSAQAIAEGVESELHLRLLRPLGVHLFQGYYWGLPSHLMSRTAHVPPWALRGGLSSRDHTVISPSSLAVP